MNSEKRIVLISGCSSGFGALCASEFAAGGDQVIATMRNPGKSSFAPNGHLDVRALDVTDADSIKTCVASVLADYGRIDVLVNNAGIHLAGAVEDMDDGEFRRLFETNFWGAVNLARAVLPSMRSRQQGRIISISSIGSLVGRVTDGAYCATKAALDRAFEAMRYEVKRFGVDVSIVCPGAFKTNIGQQFETPENHLTGSPYDDLLAFRLKKVHEAIEGGGDPVEVARLVRRVADDPAPLFRYVVGEKALQMDKTLAGMSEADREALLTQLTGIAWWVAGDEGPPK